MCFSEKKRKEKEDADHFRTGQLALEKALFILIFMVGTQAVGEELPQD